jgi:hypothetical protein
MTDNVQLASELDAMRALATTGFSPPASAVTPPPSDASAPDMSLLASVRSQIEQEAKAEDDKAVARVTPAKPVQALASAMVSYRDPTTGKVMEAQVPMRVIIKTDERMVIHRLARVVLSSSWDSATPAARQEAYAQAMCQMQWEDDASTPTWFKTAYMSDPALAVALADEVDSLQDAYFQGHDSEGHVEESRRFVVQRTV